MMTALEPAGPWPAGAIRARRVWLPTGAAGGRRARLRLYQHLLGY